MIARLLTPIADKALELLSVRRRRDHYFIQTNFLVGTHSLFVHTRRQRLTFGPGLSEQVERHLLSGRSSNSSVFEVLSCQGKHVHIRATSVGNAQLITQATVDGKQTSATTTITIHSNAETRIVLPVPSLRWESGQVHQVQLTLHAPTGEPLWEEDCWRVVSGDAQVLEPEDMTGFQLACGSPGIVIVESKKTGQRETLRVESAADMPSRDD